MESKNRAVVTRLETEFQNDNEKDSMCVCESERWKRLEASTRAYYSYTLVTWLILPVAICLSQSKFRDEWVRIVKYLLVRDCCCCRCCRIRPTRRLLSLLSLATPSNCGNLLRASSTKRSSKEKKKTEGSINLIQ